MLRAALAFWLAAAPAASETLRVGTSGDYAPFSIAAPAAPDALDGLDVELVRAFARERGLDLAFVRFRWPELGDALARGAFDLAVGGVTVRPERSVRGVFTRPVVETGAVALVRDAVRFDTLERLAQARIAVNAGGHLERVARERFPRATIVAVPDNGAPPRLLANGDVDAALTDAAEVSIWRREAPGSAVLGPFTRDAKAWWVRAERVELARELDRWLGEREADGTLARRRREWLGTPNSAAAAAPAAALRAALRERLELMPLVAEAKRAKRVPISVPDQEERVVEAAVVAARAAAVRLGRPPPSDASVRELFRAQIEAGKAIQARVLAGPPTPGPRFDLDTELRPALARISARVSELLAELDETPVSAFCQRSRGLHEICRRLDPLGHSSAPESSGCRSGAWLPLRTSSRDATRGGCSARPLDLLATRNL